MKRFWQKFFLYAKLPEMRLFWIFLPIVLIISVINFLELNPIWAFTTLGLFIFLSFSIALSSLRLAKSNLEIKVERNEMKSIVTNFTDGVIAYDPNFKILIFNRAAEQILNVSGELVIGLEFSPEYIKENKFKLLAQVLFPSLAPVMIKRSDPNIFPQVVDLSLDDSRVELRVVTDKITDPKGQLLGFMKIVHDRSREIELIKSKTEFISVAAHQLRTPLSAVNWAFENLNKEGLNEDQKSIVNSGLGAATRLLKIVNDLLDVSKIEEGKFGYNFETVDIINFVEQIVGEVMALHRGSKIKFYFQKPDISGLTLNIDPEKMKIAMMNILDNAVRYNIENGEVTVSIKEMQDQPFVEITVKDTGVGIPSQDINKLFTKFFRAENIMKIVTEGTGLGLYIVKNIIKRHGGEIWAESEVNRGTTFHLTLPTDPKLIPSKEIVYREE